ncbi:hypothetical protein QF037_001880 [Streptomyces canus]|nr:hypothetical protein [Streptomyces canus]
MQGAEPVDDTLRFGPYGLLVGDVSDQFHIVEDPARGLWLRNEIEPRDPVTAPCRRDGELLPEALAVAVQQGASTSRWSADVAQAGRRSTPLLRRGGGTDLPTAHADRARVSALAAAQTRAPTRSTSRRRVPPVTEIAAIGRGSRSWA